MSRVGLVLGGGGVTGAAFHFGALFSLRLATGWDPDDSEVVVGTSCGAFAAALVRGNALTLETLIGDATHRDEVADRLRAFIYRRARPRGVLRWMRRGILPGLTRPSLNMALGSPAMYTTDAMVEWVEHTLEGLADSWPEKPTVLVGYDLKRRRRAPFGTEAAPEVPLKLAVAASVAVPFVFEPVEIDGDWYVDGGVASGTSADLLLANPEPLDLIIVSAPMAASEARPGSRFYEEAFDRVGRTALAAELERIRTEWPGTDVLVLRPDEEVLETTRPNPMSVEAAIPTFLKTLRSFRDHLGRSENWEILSRHLLRDEATA